jgi:hypothetical protein
VKTLEDEKAGDNLEVSPGAGRETLARFRAEKIEQH